MKKRFTESQIVAAIKKQEAGVSVKDICREIGISDATFYNWKIKYGQVTYNEISKVHLLEKENAELKRMYAEMGLEIRALRSQLEGKF